MIVVACIISPTLGCGPHLVNGSNKTVHIPTGPDGMNYGLHMDYKRLTKWDAHPRTYCRLRNPNKPKWWFFMGLVRVYLCTVSADDQTDHPCRISRSWHFQKRS